MLIKKIAILSTIIAVLAMSYSSSSEANYTKRSDKWEGSFKMLNSQEFDVNGSNGSSVDVSDDLGWGFSLGYNVNPHILVNFEWTATSPRYDATLIDDGGDEHVIKHKMNMYNSQLNVVYNFMTERFTPFVQAGLGWSYMDSNIADGPPGSVCWWDPWYGYICDYYQDTYTDTRLAYNVAAGARYEFDNSMFIRASYQQIWVDLSGASTADIGLIHFEIGSIF